MRYLLLPALALLLASCGAPADTNEPASADTAASAAAATATVALEGTRWALVELNGTPVAAGASRDSVHFALNVADSMANGNAGCNNFFGRYFRKGADELRFGLLGSTMMACPDMDTERAVHAALSKVDRFKLAGGTLTLLHDTTALASWKAVR